MRYRLIGLGSYLYTKCSYVLLRDVDDGVYMKKIYWKGNFAEAIGADVEITSRKRKQNKNV